MKKRLRNFRMPDTIWNELQAAAERDGRTVTATMMDRATLNPRIFPEPSRSTLERLCDGHHLTPLQVLDILLRKQAGRGEKLPFDRAPGLMPASEGSAGFHNARHNGIVGVAGSSPVGSTTVLLSENGTEMVDPAGNDMLDHGEGMRGRDAVSRFRDHSERGHTPSARIKKTLRIAASVFALATAIPAPVR